MLSSVRCMQTSSSLSNRIKPLAFKSIDQIKLRAPIVPTHKNFDVSPTHPLWAFFPDKNQLTHSFRDNVEIQEIQSRPWTMAELRRKSFDDLHYIWYEVLKERNVIGREIRLAQGIQYDGINKHIEIDTDLSLVQKRIKVVLLERQTAYERAQLMQEKQVAYLQEFKERYLSNEEGEDIIEKLERLQYAIFGIPADLQDIDLDHDINVKFIEGVQYISDLKFSQYLQEHAGSLPEVLSNRESLESIIEQLPFLLKSGEEATQEVITMRENNVSTKIDKIDVIPFLKQAIGNFIDERIADEE